MGQVSRFRCSVLQNLHDARRSLHDHNRSCTGCSDPLVVATDRGHYRNPDRFLVLYPAAGHLVGFVLAIGIYWFIIGVFDLIRLFWDRTRWGWTLFSGIIGILAGGMIVSGMLGQNNPLGTAFVVGTTLTWVIGLMGILYGIMALIGAFRGGGLVVRRAGRVRHPLRLVHPGEPAGDDAGLALDAWLPARRGRHHVDRHRIPAALTEPASLVPFPTKEQVCLRVPGTSSNSF